PVAGRDPRSRDPALPHLVLPALPAGAGIDDRDPRTAEPRPTLFAFTPAFGRPTAGPCPRPHEGRNTPRSDERDAPLVVDGASRSEHRCVHAKARGSAHAAASA